jgi:hypothetical protein
MRLGNHFAAPGSVEPPDAARPANARLLLYVLLGALLALPCLELWLRATLLEPDMYRLDTVLGVDRIPHGTLFFGSEGGARLTLDRYGFNNDDGQWDQPSGPAGARRIAVVGNSYVEAVQLPRAENLVSQIQANRPDRVLLNIGRNGSTQYDDAELVRRLQALQKLPNLIFLANGITMETVADADAPKPDGTAGSCALRPHPASRAKELTSRIYARVALAAWEHERLPGALQRALGFAHSVLFQPAAAKGSANLAAVAQPERVLRLAGCLRAMSEGRRLVVVAVQMPSYRLGQVAPDPARLSDLHDMASAAALAGVPFYDSSPMLAAAFARDHVLRAGFANSILGQGHPNAAGDALLGQWIASQLDRMFPP